MPVVVVEDHDGGDHAAGDHEHDAVEVCPCICIIIKTLLMIAGGVITQSSLNTE